MPVATPTWRNVELMPDAMPLRSTVTTPTAVDASGVLIMPTPTPQTSSPGIRWVHSEVGSMPRIRNSPMPRTTNPGAISHFAGTFSVSRPAIAAATNDAPDRNRNRTPAPTAE